MGWDAQFVHLATLRISWWALFLGEAWWCQRVWLQGLFGRWSSGRFAACGPLLEHGAALLRTPSLQGGPWVMVSVPDVAAPWGAEADAMAGMT